MGIYSLNLDKLADYIGIPVPELKKNSYEKLETMISKMNREIFQDACKKNADDAEYERLVKKFFTPFDFLRHWFDEKEIVYACADTGVTIGDLCQEAFTEPGMRQSYYTQYGEYLRTSMEYVAQYDRDGHELAERKREKVDVYRIKNQYQGLVHGKVIEYLLYERYPKLKKFHFKFYGYNDSEYDYEIYPDGGIYVPFTALMTGDIDMIIHRNRDYCKWYNNGRYSPEECEKAFQTERTHELFDCIRQVGNKERLAGHTAITADDDGKFRMTNGMSETARPAKGNIRLLRWANNTAEQTIVFKLVSEKPMTVGKLVKEFLSINDHPVIVCVCKESDYFSEHPATISVATTSVLNNKHTIPVFHDRHKVISVFGLLANNSCKLTVRIRS